MNLQYVWALLVLVDASASPVETASIRTEEDDVSGCLWLEVLSRAGDTLHWQLPILPIHRRTTSMCTTPVSSS